MCIQSRKKPFLLVFLCTLFVLVACGNNEQATQVGNSKPMPSAHQTVPSSPTSAVQNKPPHVSPTTGPTSSVLVTTNKSHYSTSDAITVTITNNLSSSIYASAYYTNCTPVQLQIKIEASWSVLGRCPEATQSALAIQPDSSKEFQLHPSTGPMLSRVGSGATWPLGTYRISFSYTLQPDPDTSQGSRDIVSSEFSINS